MDDIERAAIRDEGHDPDDPAVVAALDRVSAELAAVGQLESPSSASSQHLHTYTWNGHSADRVLSRHTRTLSAKMK
jgi:hypothetical protein